MSIDLGVAGALEHDVRRLEIAMDDPFPVQRRQAGQPFAQHLMATPGLIVVAGPAVRMTLLMYSQRSALTRSRVRSSCPRQQAAQVVAVQPLHLHDAHAVCAMKSLMSRRLSC